MLTHNSACLPHYYAYVQLVHIPEGHDVIPERSNVKFASCSGVVDAVWAIIQKDQPDGSAVDSAIYTLRDANIMCDFYSVPIPLDRSRWIQEFRGRETNSIELF